MVETKKRKKQKTAVILSVLFWIILIFLVVYICLHLFAPKTALEVFGYRSFLTSDTKSMEPTLRYNDLVFVVKYDYDALQEGDIITYTRKVTGKDGKVTEIYVTHRIVSVVTDHETGARAYRTQGDNNKSRDPRLVTIDGADGTYVFYGKMTGKSTFLGQLTAYVVSPFGIAGLVMLVLVTILIHYILHIPTILEVSEKSKTSSSEKPAQKNKAPVSDAPKQKAHTLNPEIITPTVSEHHAVVSGKSAPQHTPQQKRVVPKNFATSQHPKIVQKIYPDTVITVTKKKSPENKHKN